MPEDKNASPYDYQAVLFDLDGVITSTASVHGLAWKQLFDEYLRQVAEKKDIPFVPFDADEDYRLYVDGKPRYEGVQSFLLSRGVSLPFGVPEDPPGMETCCGLGNKKNIFFNQALNRDGAQVFKGSVDLIHSLKAKGVRVAVVSSSKNCKVILERAGIAGLFELRLDGVEAEQEQIAGKPQPDTYIEAGRRLGVKPDKAVVVEDAISGVQAGRDGGFGLVIGVARSGNAQELLENGADIVVKDLGEFL